MIASLRTSATTSVASALLSLLQHNLCGLAIKSTSTSAQYSKSTLRFRVKDQALNVQDVDICGFGRTVHTIKANGKTYDFHILPSGLLNPEAQNLIGSGCVINVPGLFQELKALEDKDLPNARERLFISDRAHVVLQLHQKIDGLEEAELATGKIGTTGKGIGPTYSTKASRSGLRIADIFQEEIFEEKVRKLASVLFYIFSLSVITWFPSPNPCVGPSYLAGFKKRFGSLLEYDVEDELANFKLYRSQLAPMVIDQLPLLMSAQNAKVPMLVEGANAIMLDIDAGTYPYVTSSNTGLGGVFTGLSGVNPRNIQNIIGVVKAYTTRVGGGPFPTEDLGEVGNKFQEIGREFGVTTGRRRRCGWLDLVVVKYSTQVNSYTALNLTKIEHVTPKPIFLHFRAAPSAQVFSDGGVQTHGPCLILVFECAILIVMLSSVLDTFEKIKVAVAYKNPETKQSIEGFPADLVALEKVEVEYVTLNGWQQDVTKCRSFDELPFACREYVEFIEKYVGVRVAWIGVGPEREAMIVR
ncbi:hypothetical protein G7Y89_g1508 [Cudoniella acicularis]|uniref:Adenylosuccinate synthetase n=1 Tax=Cudoniella acicularis TaxID=354080 RepID=A0A8H4W9H1_9HELO|nr:hypothetical protein G7Y89_g1508 [Cudoniella acicularis]